MNINLLSKQYLVQKTFEKVLPAVRIPEKTLSCLQTVAIAAQGRLKGALERATMTMVPKETAFRAYKWRNGIMLRQANFMMINKLAILKAYLITLPIQVLVEFARA